MAAGNDSLFFSPSGTSVTGSPGGAEVPGGLSRRILPLLDAQYARVVFAFAAAGTQIRIEFSVDGGATWATLVPNSLPSVANQIVFTDWTEFPAAARTDATMIRIMIVNATVAVNVFLCEIQWR